MMKPDKELEKILRDNIDCEYHHRTQIKQTVKAILDAGYVKRSVGSNPAIPALPQKRR